MTDETRTVRPAVVPGGIFEYTERTCVFDRLGGSFKRYVLANNMPEEISSLKSGLDELSKKYVDYILESALYFPDESQRDFFGPNKELRKHYYPRWLLDDVETNRNRYPPGTDHGLPLMPQSAQDAARGKVFLDLGAFNGASVQMMEKYGPSKVCSFEISEKNAQKYLERSATFKVPFKFYRKGVGSENETLTFNDEGRPGTTLSFNVDAPNRIEVEIVTLDSFAHRSLAEQPVGFIKMDIEGSEHGAVAGGRALITKDRPLLSISIYHNPTDFFRIKPLLESWQLNYRFMIRMIDSRWTFSPFTEAVLLAYPAELSN